MLIQGLQYTVTSIVPIVVALGGLIVFHELGHFFVARLCGVRILRFSIGFGRPIWMRKFGKSETEWVIGIFPLGGYVKMLDSREIDVSTLSEHVQRGEFTRQSVWKRIAIVAAGPIANFLLAIVILSGLYVVGSETPVAKVKIASESSSAYRAGLRQGDLILKVDDVPVQSYSEMRWKLLQFGLAQQDVRLTVQRESPVNVATYSELIVTLPLTKLSKLDFETDFLGKLGVGYFRSTTVLKEVVQDGPAGKAGIQVDDKILQLGNSVVRDAQELIEIVRASPNQPLLVLVQRANQQLSFNVTPIAVLENGKTVGQLKVVPSSGLQLTKVSYPVLASIQLATEKTWEMSVLTVKMLWHIIIGEASWKNITGPITVADYAAQTAKIGLISFLSFIASISISLGVMNLLPIPVLDGGHLLYYSLEVFTGKAVPVKYVEMAQRGGLAALLCLMVVAFFNDIVRLMS